MFKGVVILSYLIIHTVILGYSKSVMIACDEWYTRGPMFTDLKRALASFK